MTGSASMAVYMLVLLGANTFIPDEWDDATLASPGLGLHAIAVQCEDDSPPAPMAYLTAVGAALANADAPDELFEGDHCGMRIGPPGSPWLRTALEVN